MASFFLTSSPSPSHFLLLTSHFVMSIATFASQRKFRAWLEQHHRTAAELLVRCYKTHAKDKGLTYRQALDEALCFGWIDGVRRAVDDESFSTRFTPRKPKSKWSVVNIKRAKELQAEGRMHSAGEAAFAARDGATSKRYSYESRPAQLDAGSLKKLRASKRAWAFFQAQPPWYRRTSVFWVMEAKREETRERRLAELIARSAKREPINLLDRRPPAAG
jgi:uncharacterized protein YdeI (YjbR/CyaY-like superfamily)